MTLAVEGGALRVDVGVTAHAVAISAEEFPDYARFLAPDPATQSVVVDRAALLSAIEAADDDLPATVRLTAGALQIGEPPVPVDVSYAGPDVALTVNAVYLHDA